MRNHNEGLIQLIYTETSPVGSNSIHRHVPYCTASSPGNLSAY
jgi:hypothetical protein